MRILPAFITALGASAAAMSTNTTNEKQAPITRRAVTSGADSTNNIPVYPLQQSQVASLTPIPNALPTCKELPNNGTFCVPAQNSITASTINGYPAVIASTNLAANPESNPLVCHNKPAGDTYVCSWQESNGDTGALELNEATNSYVGWEAAANNLTAGFIGIICTKNSTATDCFTVNQTYEPGNGFTPGSDTLNSTPPTTSSNSASSNVASSSQQTQTSAPTNSSSSQPKNGSNSATSIGAIFGYAGTAATILGGAGGFYYNRQKHLREERMARNNIELGGFGR